MKATTRMLHWAVTVFTLELEGLGSKRLEEKFGITISVSR